MEGRFIITKTEYEFFSSLESSFNRFVRSIPPESDHSTKRGYFPVIDFGPGGNTELFSLNRFNDFTKTECAFIIQKLRDLPGKDGAMLVSIHDGLGFLDEDNVIRKSYVQKPLSLVGEGYDEPLTEGPYPVISGEWLFDKMYGELYSEKNLRAFGVEPCSMEDAKTPYAALPFEQQVFIVAGSGLSEFAFTYKDVYERLAFGNPEAASRFSSMDVLNAANGITGEGRVNGNYFKSEVLDLLCKRTVTAVDRQRLKDSIVDVYCEPSFYEKMIAQEGLIRRCDDISHLKRDKEGILVGNQDGYSLYIRKWPGSDKRHEMSSGTYLSFVDKSGKSITYMHAFMKDSPLVGVADKLVDRAERRQKSLDKYKEFKRAAKSLFKGNEIK